MKAEGCDPSLLEKGADFVPAKKRVEVMASEFELISLPDPPRPESSKIKRIAQIRRMLGKDGRRRYKLLSWVGLPPAQEAKNYSPVPSTIHVSRTFKQHPDPNLPFPRIVVLEPHPSLR